MTDFQPTYPAEVQFTEAEFNFMEESPPGLFPDNQNSNFGYIIRKLFSDKMQQAINQIEGLYTERFVSNSTLYLKQWEVDYDLPIAPVGKTITQRRSMVLSRIQIGPFSRDRVKGAIEAYISATFGTPISLTPEGVAMAAGGVALFGEVAPMGTLYRVYENIRNFTYEVWIKNTVLPDTVGLSRELLRITPGGIQFTVDDTKANILSYYRAIRNKQPVWYGRFAGNANDSSEYGNHGTLNGVPAAVASPGLLVATGNDDTAAYDFDGVDDYISVPDSILLDVGDTFSLEAWVNADSFVGSRRIMAKGADAFLLYVTDAGLVTLAKYGGAIEAQSTISLVTGTTYHIVVTHSPLVTKIFINGVDSTGAITKQVFQSNSSALAIGSNPGGGSHWDGRIDEPAVYNHLLSAVQALENYNTGRNIA